MACIRSRPLDATVFNRDRTSSIQRCRRRILQHAAPKERPEREMIARGVRAAPASFLGCSRSPRPIQEPSLALARLLTCVRKPNGNRQIQLSRRHNVRYLQVGLSRQHPGNPLRYRTRRRASRRRRPPGWARTPCREKADPAGLDRCHWTVDDPGAHTPEFRRHEPASSIGSTPQRGASRRSRALSPAGPRRASVRLGRVRRARWRAHAGSSGSTHR
jgi:hypothetical protein